ncbi:biogenesis of lysosome-related organelles complex 1 subunit 1-like [Arapaima gigas]
MLSRLLKEHQAKQNERKELQERRRREAIAAATCLTEALVDHLNVGTCRCHTKQHTPLEPSDKQQLHALCHTQTLVLEIGDVENWARSIEMDMRTIATALEYVHKGQLQATS